MPINGYLVFFQPLSLTFLYLCRHKSIKSSIFLDGHTSRAYSSINKEWKNISKIFQLYWSEIFLCIKPAFTTFIDTYLDGFGRWLCSLFGGRFKITLYVYMTPAFFFYWNATTNNYASLIRRKLVIPKENLIARTLCTKLHTNKFYSKQRYS